MSKEIKKIVEAYFNNLNKNYALATVVHTSGSSYRRIGARMLVSDDGFFTGGISGGCLEGDALRRSKLAILTDKPSIVRYDTSQEQQIGVGLGCNGIIDVLFKPLGEVQSNPLELLEKRVSGSRQVLKFITVLASESQNTLGDIYDLSLKLPEFLEKYEEKFSSLNHSQILNLDPNFKVLFECIPPVIRLIILGNQYDVPALLDQCKILGWEYEVIGPQNKVDFVETVEEDKLVDLTIDDYTAVLFMSHSFETDKRRFLMLKDKNIPYLGFLGPRSRTERLFEELNISQDNASYHFPVGLDIGAENPEEIALAACAEIKAFFSKRDGGKLSLRKSPIYSNF